MKHVKLPVIFLAAVILFTCLPTVFAYASEAEDAALIEDGYYYIKNVYSNMYLQVADGQVVENSKVSHNHCTEQSSNEFLNNPCIWRIKYMGNGQYILRPYHKLDMALSLNYSPEETEYPFTVIKYFGEEDQLDSAAPNFLWSIDQDEKGYVLKLFGLDSLTLYAANGARSMFPYVFATDYDENIPSCHWQFIEVNAPEEGVALYDTYTANSFNGQVKFLLTGHTITMEELGLAAVSYSTTSLSQAFVWTSDFPNVASVDATTGTITTHAGGDTLITGTHILTGQTVHYYIYIMRAYVAGVADKSTLGYDLTLEEHAYVIESFADTLRNDIGYDTRFDPLVFPNSLRHALQYRQVICLEGHGTQHQIKMGTYQGVKVVVSDADPLEQEETQTLVLLKNYDLSNVNLMVILACEAASNYDGTGTNFCLTAYQQGAECVLGWAESIYFYDGELWMARFQQKLAEGWTVKDATRYANSFLYYANLPICERCHEQKKFDDGIIVCPCNAPIYSHFSVYDCSSIKSTRIYGNEEVVISLESANMDNSENSNIFYGVGYYDLRNEGYVMQENVSANWQTIFSIIGELIAETDQEITNYEQVISYTSDDGDDYIWDFVYLPYEAAPGQLYGYTVIVEDNVIVGIRDNMNTNS